VRFQAVNINHPEETERFAGAHLWYSLLRCGAFDTTQSLLLIPLLIRLH
jgi:hypothetical protein